MIGRLLTGLRRAAVRSVRTVTFLGHYGRLFLLANLVVAREILTPGSGLAPAIVELPLRRPSSSCRCAGRTPLEIASIAHLITLTPGTLVVEVRVDPPTLFVHGTHAAAAALFRRQLSDLEDRLLAVLRPAGGDAS